MTLNIVQAEFFHVDGETLDDIFRECARRIEDALPLWSRGINVSPGIKTTVRFFDVTGRITAWALRADQLEARFALLAQKAEHATGIWQWFLFRRSGSAFKKSLALRKKVKKLVAIQCCKALQSREPVVIETGSLALRPVRGDEVYELVLAIQKTKNAWIFIFKPNDLAASTNEPVTDVM